MRDSCRLIGTSNHGFAHYAQEEIKRLFPGHVKFTYLLPGEVFFIDIDCEMTEAVTILRRHEPIFLRHLQPVDDELQVHGSLADLQTVRAFAGHNLNIQRSETVAVQVRKAPGLNLEYSAFAVKDAVDEVLIEVYQATPAIQNALQIISIYITSNVMYCGISRAEHNLSDWAGGAIRFQREEGQISRAAFKLLEAEVKFALDFSQFQTALDIGAAPAGWTSLLLDRGARVTAVDPAKLVPSLMRNPRLRYLPKNAGEVSFDDHSFDLLVCDMSWSPRQMVKLLTSLLRCLKEGGTLIVTVKLMHKKPLQTVKEAIDAFSPSLQLLHAKQLFHNREEVTLHFVKIN